MIGINKLCLISCLVYDDVRVGCCVFIFILLNNLSASHISSDLSHIKENIVKNGGRIIDVCTGAPPDVVTALALAHHLAEEQSGNFLCNHFVTYHWLQQWTKCEVQIR